MRFAGEGGFYGRGVYLAENPAYQVGGRYAHRLSGHGGARMQLLIVRAALGTQQQLGTLVTPATRKMTMPANRGHERAYDSVRAGPHRPQLSGPGDGGDGDDASIVHVIYHSEQMCVARFPFSLCA